jgi:Tfp pilus assembly protein PilX
MTRARSAFSARRQRGSVLLAALCFAIVLGLAVGSYVSLCHRTLQLSTRALQSSRNFAVAEAGMEEALWALNKDDWTGWTFNGQTATKVLSGFDHGGGAAGSATVTIRTAADGSRSVKVTGATTQQDGKVSSRTVGATAQRAPLFVNAVAATTGTIRFTSASNSTVVDSYRSSDPASLLTPGFSAVLSAGSTSTSSATVQLTNAQVKGYVATMATGPSYSIGARLLGPATPTLTRIDSTRVSTSPYQPVFDISLPTGPRSPLPTNPKLGTPGATTPSIYSTAEFDLRNGATLTIDGPVKLVVSGAFQIGRNGSATPGLKISPTGSLEVFVGGDIFIGADGIQNVSGIPARLAIFSTSTLATSEMNTPTPFHGVLYLPNGDITVSSNNPIFGAIVARNVLFTGPAPVVHYDTDLRSAVFAGIETPYAISDWRETTNEN